MELSENGIKFIEANEGCVLRAYKDTGGVWTIGYGHTNGVRPNDIITREQADALFRLDKKYAEDVVNAHALPATQNQFDAMVDFVFNIGPTKFLTSTFLKHHLAGEYEKAAAEFPKWKYDNGLVIAGLVARRQREKDLYSLQ